jgi:hypothetical protein
LRQFVGLLRFNGPMAGSEDSDEIAFRNATIFDFLFRAVHGTQ